MALPYALPPHVDDGLRFYQREAALGILNCLKARRAALLVLATGLGKTQVFASIAAETPGRVLILCHRDELVEQARRRLEIVTGEWVQREQGQFRAELTTRIVVASVDTIRRKSRLERFPRDHFALVIVDEAHHYVGNSFVAPLEYFESAKVLGVTATPDRADGKALGQVFDEVAYQMDIDAGIDLGYLVPITGKFVTLDEIDISAVGKTGKDLSVGQLDEAMLKAVEGVVRETLRLEPGRQGIAFFPGVTSARYAAERFNALSPGCARFVSGDLEPAERQAIIRSFRRGEFRILCNCMVATEGFDVPEVSLIIQARPTLSRALYTQMIGRGTRTLPGLVDVFPLAEQAADRRRAIAESGKPDLVVLDFVGNSGRHSLISLEDVLGGRYTDVEVREAKKKRKAGCDDPRAALLAARAELKALAANMQASVKKSTVTAFDPFRAFAMRSPVPEPGMHNRRPIAKHQRVFLEAAGIPLDALVQTGYRDAQKLMEAIKNRRVKGLATYKQLRALSKWGVASPTLTFQRASAALSYLSNKNWGRSELVEKLVLERLTQPGPGEER